MTSTPSISFAKFAAPSRGSAIVLVTEGGAMGDAAAALGGADGFSRAFAAADFSGRSGRSVEILAPEGSALDRVVALGVGNPGEMDDYGWLKLGGSAGAALRKSAEVALIAELADRALEPGEVARLAAGLLLRSYKFDKYKSRNDNDDADEKPAADKAAKVTIHCADPAAAKKAFADLKAVVDGVTLARDLVNEPANVLGPVEFAASAAKLEKLGVTVEVLTEKEMKKLGMGALLGVAQGSVRPPRLVVMRWNGGKAKETPLAFIGKGVVFDSGGVSIKTAGGMEDMKGDMGGAATVTGLMHALAARKARVNAVGILGCVENMVDGNSQRPGDIVTSMSGQTIEVLNTDAEGRLVLADALWYCNERFQPKFMINLATLTGAVMVALGKSHAGLFSNDDELAERLTKAGLATQEKLWRLPLGPEYDKLIDSKNADMKNIGGRHGGAITAAQFLKRFVKDTPWAHIDIAGTAMAAPSSEINQSWASGFGVRLLDQLVRDHYEN